MIVSKTAALSVMDNEREANASESKMWDHTVSAKTKFNRAHTRKSTIRQSTLNDIIAIFMIDK